ncbi:MAG: HTH domain-containing protein, partial [Oscillospiraceae bacterium]|nr:HTH domain-containing protein [Oscillospiraceae bacterium]
MDALEMTLLYDFYGELLTERQKMCFELYHDQDLSLAEIAQELKVSRQGVYDNL